MGKKISTIGVFFWGRLLCGFFAFCLLCVGVLVYDCYSFEYRYARAALPCFAQEDLQVVDVVRKGFLGGGFAVFLRMSKAQFDVLSLELKGFSTWLPLEQGSLIEVNAEHVLQVPQDVGGVYAFDVSPNNSGLTPMMIWDESRELLVVLAAEGFF